MQNIPNRAGGWGDLGVGRPASNICITERDFYTTLIRRECSIILCVLCVWEYGIIRKENTDCADWLADYGRLSLL